jgi:GT2 family glycosyltransferase
VNRTLTVLIATHDRAELLERALRHLNEARRPQGWQVEVLVVANACTDRTHDHLARYVAMGAAAAGARQVPPLTLKWVAEPIAGKSHALNRAIPLLTSEFVAFVDDDHRVDAGYLENVCKAATTNPGVDIFCGRIIPDWDGSEPAWVHDNGPYRIYPLPVPRYDLGDRPVESPQETATPGGGNWILHRDLFARVGPFSTGYGPVGRGLGGSEDKEWVWRAIAVGARVLYLPDIVQYHYVDLARLEISYLMHKAFERTAGAVRLSGETMAAGALPAYMIRKVAANSLAILIPGSRQKHRFHLVRLASALGEIKGHLKARSERSKRPRGNSN